MGTKILLKILTSRLESTRVISCQFGFRKGRGTRDAIAALRVLYEMNLECNNKYLMTISVCYVDDKKAFDRVDWTKLMTILQNIGVDWRDRKLI